MEQPKTTKEGAETNIERQNEAPLKDKVEGGVVTQNRINPQELEKSEEVKKDQERTRINKQLFLEMLPQCRGIIRMTCAKIGIGERTYYDWRDNDPEFNEKVAKQYAHLKEEIRDVLLKKILVEADGPSVRYWLDRKDPEFMPKAKTEVITGSRTLEDLLDEDEENLNKENGESNSTNEDRTPKEEKERSETTDRGTIQDKKQEGGTDTVQVQQGSAVLLEKENEKKPDSQSETKRDQQGNRRGPAPRVHSERH